MFDGIEKFALECILRMSEIVDKTEDWSGRKFIDKRKIFIT